MCRSKAPATELPQDSTPLPDPAGALFGGLGFRVKGSGFRGKGPITSSIKGLEFGARCRLQDVGPEAS